jgi:hypothetical protein
MVVTKESGFFSLSVQCLCVSLHRFKTQDEKGYSFQVPPDPWEIQFGGRGTKQDRGRNEKNDMMGLFLSQCRHPIEVSKEWCRLVKAAFAAVPITYTFHRYLGLGDPKYHIFTAHLQNVLSCKIN